MRKEEKRREEERREQKRREEDSYLYLVPFIHLFSIFEVRNNSSAERRK